MQEFPDQLLQWQAGSLGRALIGAEAKLLGAAFDDVFGLELLQVGQWGQGRELLAGSRIRRQTLLGHVGGDLVASPAHLPIATGSIDAVLLPHVLEVAPDPHAVLREADRVLGGEGKLLVLGFRPGSLWGLRAAASRASFPPGLQRTLSEGRVRDWLVLLGYDILGAARYLYRFPSNPRSTPESAVASVLRRGWFYPFPAAAYLLKARKRVYAVTPVRPKLRERRAVLGGLVEPTT